MDDFVISTFPGSIRTPTRSTVMKNLVAIVERIAPSDLSVLIVGENGTGKEWIARAIHQSSPRADKKFVPVDCVEFPHDKFMETLFGFEASTGTRIDSIHGAIEQAEGGTIFLDDVGELPSTIQKQIGRMFGRQIFRRVGGKEDTRRNVRLIAALNRKVKGPLVGSFRPTDIDHSISPIIVNLPPLREHREDIPYLIETFFLQFNNEREGSKTVISPEALRLCLSYDWPGNIRQLRTAVEYAAAKCQEHIVQVEDLPLYVDHSRKSEETLGDHPGLRPSALHTGEGTPIDPRAEQIEKRKATSQ
jgi:DNA-binding NtrC family response regulator